MPPNTIPIDTPPKKKWWIWLWWIIAWPILAVGGFFLLALVLVVAGYGTIGFGVGLAWVYYLPNLLPFFLLGGIIHQGVHIFAPPAMSKWHSFLRIAVIGVAMGALFYVLLPTMMEAHFSERFVLHPFIRSVCFFKGDCRPEALADLPLLQMPRKESEVNIQTIPTSTLNNVKSTFSTNNGTSTLTSFEDKELGIKFEYPSVWGKIRVSTEGGECPQELGEILCNQRMLSFEDLVDYGGIFLSAETPMHQKYPAGRGAFWGDKAGTITSQYIGDCFDDEKCKDFTNDFGVRFAKYYHPTGDFNSSDNEYEYYVFNPNSEYQGIILSPQRIKYVGKDPRQWSEREQLFEDFIIRSFRFVK